MLGVTAGGELVGGVAAGGMGGLMPAAAAATPDRAGRTDLRAALTAMAGGPAAGEHRHADPTPAPFHTDPAPPGVDPTAPTDTRSLYRRAGLALPSDATRNDGPTRDSESETAGNAPTPPGAPVVPGIAEHVQPSCTGTGTDGKRVEVIYAHRSDRASRYGAVLDLIRHEIATVDDVFAVSSDKTYGGRRVRWVHDGACVPVVREVALAPSALGGDFGATITALQAAGYTSSARKYLVFADVNELCGIASYWEDTRLSGNLNDTRAGYSRVDTRCWVTNTVSTAAHELTHNFGGVLETAPNATPYGHCDDEYDVMCYPDGPGVTMRFPCPSSHAALLDCNGDDYFSTDPPPGSFLATNWNTASSGFLDTVAPLAAGPPDPPGPAPVATTRLDATAAPSGDRTVLRATLTESSGDAVAGRIVTLQARVGTAPWMRVTRRTTDEAGVVRARIRPPRTTTYRWVHAATETTTRSISNKIRVWP